MRAYAAAAAASVAVGMAILLRKRHAKPSRAGCSTERVEHEYELNECTSTDGLVVVVGLGGVGSHVAQLLLRGGVRRMRLVDFDQVTLSSLNRHATAVRADVGIPKAVALKAALLRIVPDAELDARVELFDDSAADRTLSGRPALVIDAIDDLATKAALLGHCVRLGLRVVSALGAGGKADACALHVGRLSEVFNDPIAASMLKRLRKQKQQESQAAEGCLTQGEADGKRSTGTESLIPWWEEMAHRVTVVYSSEQQRVSLLPLPENTAASDLGAQPNFRVRVMPVLPPLPAASGAACASHALAILANHPVMPPPRPVPALSTTYLLKLYQKFVKHEVSVRKRPASEVTLSYAEVALVVCDIFRCRCALTGRRLHDPARPVFRLVRYDPHRQADAANVLFAITEAAEAHEQEGLDVLPKPLRAQVDKAFLDGLAGRRESIFEEMKRAI